MRVRPAHRHGFSAARARPIVIRPLRFARPAVPARRPFGIEGMPPLPSPDAASPYLDYARVLTPEGGVLIIYKDIDTRWRWIAWRVLAWSLATGFDGWLAFYQSPVESIWLNALCWLIAAGLNLLAVWRAIAVQRRIEARPDCLILDGSEVFWRERMEGGWPELRPKDEKAETFILGGVYGTRFVEYGTLRRFDDNDRQPETFAAHFRMAVEQLWEGDN